MKKICLLSMLIFLANIHLNALEIATPIVITDDYYGIFSDDDLMENIWNMSDEDKNLWIWEGTMSSIAGDPVLGENVWAFATEETQWWGFGVYDNTGLNLSHFENGYLVFHIKIDTEEMFEVGVESPAIGEQKREGKIKFEVGNDPFGFVRNGEWQRVVIPVSDLVEQGVDLTHVSSPFFAWGMGDHDAIMFDEIYFTTQDVTTSIINQKNQPMLGVYPNPSNGDVFINFNGSVKSIVVLDVAGRVVLDNQVGDVNSFLIDASSWRKGVYFVKASDSFGNTDVKKLIIR
jgi:hypothetical protein